MKIFKKPIIYVYIFQTKYGFEMQQNINHEQSFQNLLHQYKRIILENVFDMKMEIF